jgi:hypothetical protein
VDKSHAQSAQLETMLCLHQPLALNVHLAHLDQSLQLVQLSAQDNAVKVFTVLQDQHRRNKIHAEM